MVMKFNTAYKLCLLIVLTVSHLLLIPCHCQEREEEKSAEEELFECFVKCGRQRSDVRELNECEEKCVKHFQERKEREREREEKSEGRGGGATDHHRPDPVQQYKQCQAKCGREEHEEQRQHCRQICQTEYERQKREHEGGRDHRTLNTRKERPGKEEKQETENPYYFESQRFDTKYRTQHGHIKVLERFSKVSELLQGIENYRLSVLEADPNTFVVPHHCDAESVFLVVGGKGRISYMWENQRQSYNLQQGDVMRVPAGSLVYLINHDDNERLYVLKLLQPVNTPGHFKEYFGVGGENPESFYRTFSNEILEAAFNTPKERLEKLFGQQRKGVIIKASKEQIRALSQESESSRRGRRGDSWGPFNLLDQRPLFSNRFGKFFEALPKDFMQLKDLDVSVAVMNINKGGMTAPYYNSKSTKVVFVVGGNGQLEMACPHLSAQGKRQGSHGKKERQEEIRTEVHYERVTARLSHGDTFIIPAGHPIIIIASQDSNLLLAGFGIKASDSQKNFLTGRENIWNEVESEAKELSFKVPAKEVEEIFKNQEESYFLPGPGQKKEGRANTVASILDFVGF